MYEILEGWNSCKIWRSVQGGRIANRLFYLSIPPDIFIDVARCVSHSSSSEKGWSRVIVEKPFGRDSKSSAELTKGLKQFLAEEQIYRFPFNSFCYLYTHAFNLKPRICNAKARNYNMCVFYWIVNFVWNLKKFDLFFLFLWWILHRFNKCIWQMYGNKANLITTICVQDWPLFGEGASWKPLCFKILQPCVWAPMVTAIHTKCSVPFLWRFWDRGSWGVLIVTFNFNPYN